MMTVQESQKSCELVRMYSVSTCLLTYRVISNDFSLKTQQGTNLNHSAIGEIQAGFIGLGLNYGRILIFNSKSYYIRLNYITLG